MLTRQSTDPPNPSVSSSKRFSSRAPQPTVVSPVASTSAGGGGPPPPPVVPPLPAYPPPPSPASRAMQPPPLPGQSGHAPSTSQHNRDGSSLPNGNSLSESSSGAAGAQSGPLHFAPGPAQDLPHQAAPGSSYRNLTSEQEAVPGEAARGIGGEAPDSPAQYAPAPFGFPPPVTGGRWSSSTVNGGAGPPARAGSSPEPAGDVIDLTTSSPPASSRQRRLVPAAEASGLILPGSRAAATRQGSARRAATHGAAMTLSSGDDSDDSDWAPLASTSRARPSNATASTGPSAFAASSNGRRRPPPRRATRFNALGPNLTDSDSEIEVVSERPATQSEREDLRSRLPWMNLDTGGRFSRSGGVERSSPPRRSTRLQAGADAAPTNRRDDPEEADLAFARALAEAEASDLGLQDYLDAQHSAQRQRGAPPPSSRGGEIPASWYAGRGGAAASRGRGFRGLFGGNVGHQIGALLGEVFSDPMMHSLGGGLWGGGRQYLGGYGSTAAALGGYGGAGPMGGWGGAAKVKAASKKYGVRMSHPSTVEKGFSRDIVEPRDPDAPAPALPDVSTSASKKGRAKNPKPQEELEPVCASCLETLVLSGTGDKKVFALCCGHVVCAKCLNAAKARCRAIREQEKGGWVLDDDDDSPRKGKRKANEMPGTLSLADEEDEDDADGLYEPNGDIPVSGRSPKRRKPNGVDQLAAGATTSTKGKGKGKAKSRADQTGVEEDWTTCPVATCDGKGSDLLAEEGWSRPYELFT
ncbi:hypothetical protein JCM8202_004265 [Rhodotorula sphaerocarpa]